MAKMNNNIDRFIISNNIIYKKERLYGVLRSIIIDR